MRDVFIADAHLRLPTDENYRRLLAFLDEEKGRIRTLYLLGDIFEFWVGYRHVAFSAYVPLLEELRKLRQSGTEIVYVEGNHDFHMGPYFAEILQCRILPDGGSIDLDGTPVFIAHGDLVNPHDRGYRTWRRVLRSRILQTMIGVFPPDWIWGIAAWAGRQSGKKHASRRARWIPRDMLRAHAALRFSEGFRAVVTGHFHTPLLEQEEEGVLLSLGDWLTQYSYAVWEDGKFTLRTYPVKARN
jgi:UDP-2,3-diacylglucosamine hydrolase